MGTKELREIIMAFGHPNIQAIHPSTLMITKDKHLSKTGDCIVAVGADKAPADLSEAFKDKVKTENVKLTIIIEAGEFKETIQAQGSPNLVLTDATDIVIRKSEFISNRTLAIKADKSSNELPREFVQKLKNTNQKITITLVVS